MDTPATTTLRVHQDDEMDELAETQPLWTEPGRDHNPTDDDTELETEPQVKELEPRLRTRKRRASGRVSKATSSEKEVTRSINTSQKQQRKRRRTRQNLDDDDDDDDDTNNEVHRMLAEKIANGRTINFESVYANGRGQREIIAYPENSNNWFILQCGDHMFTSSHKTLVRSMRHIEGQGHYRASEELAVVKEMGIVVMNCNQKKATRNNQAAMSNPSSARKIRTSLCTKFEGITNPEVGGMYIGYKNFHLSKDPHWTVLIILPWGSFNPIGMTESIAKTDLSENIPNCYRSKNSMITGWAKHFEDGGSKVNQRRFPVLCLEDWKLPVKNGRYLDLPPLKQFFWIGAPALRPLSKIDPNGTAVRGYETALDYLAKIVDIDILPALASHKSHLLQSSGNVSVRCYSNPHPPPSRSSLEVHLGTSAARKSLDGQRGWPLRTPRRNGRIHHKTPISKQSEHNQQLQSCGQTMTKLSRIGDCVGEMTPAQNAEGDGVQIIEPENRRVPDKTRSIGISNVDHGATVEHENDCIQAQLLSLQS